MPYARKTNENELVRLRDEITSEVNTDSEHLARSVFGNLGKHPDMQRMDNDQIDGLYRAAYQRNDRTFLQAEARRDPEQFLKATQRLGVTIPPPPPPVPVPLPTPAVPVPPAQLASPAVVPTVPPAPVVQAGPPPALPTAGPALPVAPPAPAAGQPPVILGPNGQPLLTRMPET